MPVRGPPPLPRLLHPLIEAVVFGESPFAFAATRTAAPQRGIQIVVRSLTLFIKSSKTGHCESALADAFDEHLSFLLLKRRHSWTAQVNGRGCRPRDQSATQRVVPPFLEFLDGVSTDQKQDEVEGPPAGPDLTAGRVIAATDQQTSGTPIDHHTETQVSQIGMARFHTVQFSNDLAAGLAPVRNEQPFFKNVKMGRQLRCATPERRPGPRLRLRQLIRRVRPEKPRAKKKTRGRAEAEWALARLPRAVQSPATSPQAAESPVNTTLRRHRDRRPACRS